MKPRRFFFRSTQLFGAPIHVGAPLALGFSFLLSGLGADAGDILRGGSSFTRGNGRKGANIDTPTPAAADAARANARDTLARTTRTLQAMQAMQQAARTAARKGANNLGRNPANPAIKLPDVPNGLGTNGLQVSSSLSTDPTKWTGAKLPTQEKSKGRTHVTIKQTEQNALLHWDTFNVGKRTTLTFDQTKGGENSGQWIAFNHVTDPAANPTQILGNIKADGQIYIINPNGVIFGGTSSVNARGLTVSSLPINTNLISQGLLNNRDAQFLFSGLTVPGGSDGTPAFDPGPAPAAGYGDVTVRAGARLATPSDSAGNGGRIMLVGSNVTNDGTISTPAGQTIFAAGSQVAVAAHNSSDPSLRGLDVWVGAVLDGAGSATNNGLIESYLGNTVITGRDVRQLGTIGSSTSVALNGRIDLRASYGAVANPNFDSTGDPGAGAPPFFYQHSGSVTLGEGSSTRILPDYASKKAVPGTELPERSQVNIDGNAIHFAERSILFAPNGLVNVRSGEWTYRDGDDNRTIYTETGAVEPGLTNHYSGTTQKFLFNSGQIYVDKRARISVAGSVDVFVPLSQDILSVELRGAELADSPLQRQESSTIRGVPMTVDLRDTGVFNGRFWQGTPLGDLTGLAGIIERNAAQLTAVGGDITLHSGGSIVVREKAQLDVSGGYLRHEGGAIRTSSLISGGRLVSIKEATPDRVYDGVFNGRSTIIHEKWGITETYATPLFTAGGGNKPVIEGAAGGTLTLTAPGMAVQGELRGATVRGERQRSAPPAPGTLKINFEADKAVNIPGGSAVDYIQHSPTPPEVVFTRRTPEIDLPEFTLANGAPGELPENLLGRFELSTGLLDDETFGALEIRNPDASITLPEGLKLRAREGGALRLAGANVSILGDIVIPGGTVEIATYNISPAVAAESDILNPAGSVPFPTAIEGRGLFVLGADARISTAGRISNDLPESRGPFLEPIATNGGTVAVRSLSADLRGGSIIDVSGGIHVSDKGTRSFGNAGTITLATGTDPGFAGVTGGSIHLGASLRGFSGAKGGTLNLQAGRIRVGGTDPGGLHLDAGFFQRGGFTSFNLTGIGAASSAPVPAGRFESYEAGLVIAADTRIRPRATQWTAEEDMAGGHRIRLVRGLAAPGLRFPTSISFSATGVDDPFTIDSLDIRGDLVMERGATIRTDAGASVSFKGDTVTLAGSIRAPGGSVSVSGATSFPLTTSQRLSVTQALATVHLTRDANISVAGTFLRKPDNFGRRTGTVFDGGNISISGNIIAEKGSSLDASGTSAVLDLDPRMLASEGLETTLAMSGLNTQPIAIRGVATRVDSDGGTITLAGAQMLLSDAALTGNAGGETAAGGMLSVSSGRFYAEGESRTGADINLVVTQSGDVIRDPAGEVAIGLGVFDADGSAYGNSGEFSLGRFHRGGFASLSLGGNYSTSGAVPFGGNVAFSGPIRLRVPGSLRLAAGGIVSADDKVLIRSSYLAVGQEFRAPRNPDDTFLPFQKTPAIPTASHTFAPIHGPGDITFKAKLVDLGTLSLQNIGNAGFIAGKGEIRGNGTVHLAGNLTLDATAIYPTTGADFNLFAYDTPTGAGSITILSRGTGDVPMSAAGNLGVYASHITHRGVLRAPFGTIRLGWDGTDLDPSDADLDSPVDIIAGSSTAAPVATEVVLGRGSVTSVSAVSREGSVITPYGISPDGRSWIDPGGVNVSLSGMPGKAVHVSGENVTMAPGSVIDLRGGGDLLASRWISGGGGSVDLLGTPEGSWNAGVEYQAGDLVSHNGAMWSSRVPHSGQSPTPGLYWTKVTESFAILPEASLRFAPFSPFNTGANADPLAGDPGLASTSLKVGDTITLEGGKGVPGGTYTLLPARYALLPGALLVKPLSATGAGTIVAADGSRHVSGYLSNRFAAAGAAPAARLRFEVSTPEVFSQRAEYAVFHAGKFLPQLAEDSGSETVQTLPGDAGSAAFHGNSALRLAGKLRTKSPGLGAAVDISSFADIRLGNSTAPSSGSVVLDSTVLSSWNVDSLLIGGLRHKATDGTTSVDVRTNNLHIANQGSTLTAADVTLAAHTTVVAENGSRILTTGSEGFTSDPLSLAGDGALLRISSDSAATVVRTDATLTGNAMVEIGSGVRLAGGSVLLDSTGGMSLARDTRLTADSLAISSGVIHLDLGAGASASQGELVLGGRALTRVFESNNVALRSYSTIDIHGSGILGGAELDSLVLSAGAIRGFSNVGTTTVRAGSILIENSLGAAKATVPGTGGTLALRGGDILFGNGDSSLTGYRTLSLHATRSVGVTGVGSFGTNGNLFARTPVFTGSGGSTHSLTATGNVRFTPSNRPGQPLAPELGANVTITGSSISADTDFLLPSGRITLNALQGDLTVNGSLSAAGTTRTFGKTIRHTGGGEIVLHSVHGDVLIGETATVSVSADKGGNAGSLNVQAAEGSFRNSGTLLGRSADGYNGGSFRLDVASLDASGASSLAAVNSTLADGGFVASREFRVRSGDVRIDHNITSHHFSLAADQGSILVTGSIDASGPTGGSIALSAHGNLVLASGSRLSVAAETFNSAGKGGSVLLEAGAQRDGLANLTATLDLQTGSSIDLGVDEFTPGSFTTPGSSAFEGKFTGTLHLRAPRTVTNDDLGIAAIGSSITGASSIVAEGFTVYQPAGGTLDIALRNQIHADNTAFLGSDGSTGGNEAAIRSRILAGTPGAGRIASALVLAPGVEIVNPTGDLTLGLANPTGSTNVESLAAADWDLSSFRYGSRGAPGVLTLRAGGDIIFNNTLSDGFTPIAQGSSTVFADNGHSLMWLATLSTISDKLPVNTQSWSYRITAGADTNAAGFRSVLSADELDLAQPGKGSVIVGEFYPAVPNSSATGTAAAIGSNGQTADSIRISTNTTNRGNRFEVVRTGTGDITVTAGRDIQLRNQFSTIYTAGVALPTPTSVFGDSDFVVPITPTSVTRHPSQSGGAGVTLGAVQQLYGATWSMAGGNIDLTAGRDIGRFTMENGVITIDASRQMPTNWLYRRGYVDPITGLFSTDGGFGDNPNIQNQFNVHDPATSTAWWVDFSNFFQGVGTLGGGNIDISAGNDVINLDAVAPTNARMAGRTKNPAFGIVPDAPEFLNLAPDEANLLELGGGDIHVRAGRDISGGVYYVERGKGTLDAGGSVTTNFRRSPSAGALEGLDLLDPLTWLPTTLFVGKSGFDVTARGDVLLGPVSNPFLMPQGLNNRYWYKTWFSTFSEDAGVTAASYGGDVTHRMEVTLPDASTSRSILDVWFSNQNLFNGLGTSSNGSNYQPWTRLVETGLETYSGAFRLAAPTLRSTSFGGAINLVGSWSLAPSPTGNLDLAAAGDIVGLNPTGPGRINNRTTQIWTASTINLSDASPSSIPGVASPLGYQSLTGPDRVAAVQSLVDALQGVTLALSETGSYSGNAATSIVKQSLHGSSGVLHRDDPDPVRIHSAGGDITGIRLFTPKRTEIIAARDITDVAFYLQNTDREDISIVSAGRDIIPFNENAPVRRLASDLESGNIVGNPSSLTSAGTLSNALAGDIQISGPGVLEVLAGRNIDLGTGANYSDGTGVGITSIGNNRNPNLPFVGADLIILGGTSASGGGPAIGLSGSRLDFAAFLDSFVKDPDEIESDYLKRIGKTGDFGSLDEEQQAIATLEIFHQTLAKAGKTAAKTGSYKAGYKAIRTLFGTTKPDGEINMRAREIRTTSGGSISVDVPGGGIAMASDIFGNPLTPPGIVTEYGGSIATFTDGSVDIGRARIFTLRGGDITMWSSRGNIAAGSSPRTVVTAPPTRVLIDVTSADIQTDLGGLATGGGIGVLAAVEGVKPGNVNLIAPKGFVDAGDAGIRVTGNLNIAAQVVLNSANISVAGNTTGSSVSVSTAPSVSTVTSAANATAATTAAAPKPQEEQKPADTIPSAEAEASIITVTVIGYGGGSADEEEEEENPGPESQ